MLCSRWPPARAAEPVPGFDGRRFLVTGVLNEQSIAWHVAAALQRRGAEVLLTSFGRAARLARKAADLLPRPAELLTLDVTDESHFAELAEQLALRCDSLDGVVHSIAFAAADAVGGGFVSTSPASVTGGFGVSVGSFQQLAQALLPLLSASEHGGAVVGLTVDSSRALPGYDWMGVYKASLESAARYLAMYLGPRRVRVNLVASGPLETISARGVPSFDALAEYYESWAPLGWDRKDPEQLLGAVLFLLSDWSRHTTGQVVHADGGTHAVAAIGTPPVRPGRE